MTRIMAVLCLAVCVAAEARAQCQTPHYRTGFILADSDSDFIGSISVPLPDFTPSKLVCLANNLKERFKMKSSVIVNIFSSRIAAWYQFPLFEDPGVKVRKQFEQMQAQDVFDTSTHEEYIVLKPEGDSPMVRGLASDTRIDLPVMGTIHCRPEINNRCLIAFQSVAYPELNGRKFSGRVTLAAVIATGGRIGHVRVMKSEATPGGGTDTLAKAAAQSLASWRLEPAPRQESLQITFSYVIDSSLRYRGETKVDWALPNEVTIRGSPLE